eukprot:Nitzschia sp. Nitz4//scaffold122_size67431//56707//57835//NITZ4_006095-RA/size67431-augustus-gene-0.54-mRNA-1//1//CDS//3329534433//4322//frame0
MSLRDPNSEFQVGCIVRAPRQGQASDSKKQRPVLGRATIATIQGDLVSLVWEPCIPRPGAGDTRFLIAPNLESSSKSSELNETDMSLSQIQLLLPFENAAVCEKDVTTEVCKDQGDQLLRLGDPTSAILYYEQALQLSSADLSIGSTVIVKQKGFPVIAEIDCVDESDSTLDLTILETDQEETVRSSQVLISVLPSDPDHLQERILLNLTRCLLQQAPLDVPHRHKYLASAVLASTLVLSISSFREESTGKLSEWAQTALVLRIKASCGLSKWSHATADAKRLQREGNSQGATLLESIASQKRIQQNKDKKLVKAMSRLVQSATNMPSENDDSV